MPADFPRPVTITPEAAALGQVRLSDSGRLEPPHKNKYGRDYETAKPSSPVYK